MILVTELKLKKVNIVLLFIIHIVLNISNKIIIYIMIYIYNLFKFIYFITNFSSYKMLINTIRLYIIKLT